MIRKKTLWRPQFHFTPPLGWINDPNGLIFFGGRYHLFFQYNPHHCDWDSMHWGHAVSDDFVHWETLPVALAPDQPYDRHPEGGCFSGSVIEKDGVLFLFYTGSVKTADGRTVQTQCMASSSNGITFAKYAENPVIALPPEEGVIDFRDPKVFFWEGRYYMVVGASEGGADTGGDGRIYLYASDDLLQWEYRGKVVESGGRLGTMMECPDLFPLGGRWVVTFSAMYHPEGIVNCYLVGDMDFEACRFTPLNVGRLDDGPDYYAAQSYALPSGERVALAWQSGWPWMPAFCGWGPTAREGWRGTLSTPRRYFLNESLELCSAPMPIWEPFIKSNAAWRNVHISDRRWVIARSICFVLTLTLRPEDLHGPVEIRALDDGITRIKVVVDLTAGALEAERFGSGMRVPAVRVPFLPRAGRCTLQVFADQSSATLCVNGGERMVTFNVYPRRTKAWLSIRTTSVSGTIETMECSILGCGMLKRQS